MIRNSRSKKNKNIFQIKYKRNLVDRIAEKKVYKYKFVEKNTDYIVKLGGCFLDNNSEEIWEDDWAK